MYIFKKIMKVTALWNWLGTGQKISLYKKPENNSGVVEKLGNFYQLPHLPNNLGLLYHFDRSFTSRITLEKNYFFLFALNQKKIYRPSRTKIFPKS